MRILIVEDNEDDLLLIEKYLAEYIAQAEMLHASDFNTASQLLLVNKPFDIVLLDLTLPDNSGEKLVTQFVSICNDCPVIALTGYNDCEFSICSLSIGVSDYLLKDDLTAIMLYKSVVYNIERRKIMTELLQARRHYSDLFTLSPEPMWVFDNDSLRFLDVNLAAIEHYGYSREDFLAMTIREIRPAEDVVILADAISRSTHDKTIYPEVFRHVKKSGVEMLVNIQSAMVEFNGQKAKLVIARDVTEKLHYIRTIEQQNKRLKEISFMQSHVVRAPLARMMGLIQLLEQPGNSESEISEYLQYILRSAHEIDAVIHDISGNSKDVTC